ncbi:MAG TPA: hypothetical protein PKW41_02815 [Clostridia bacterium]|jgi:hypothetical protein|nr:hypothetical protein [Clostridia bacterium]HPK14902.1 hypothetical protein [Clostridia bacterium]
MGIVEAGQQKLPLHIDGVEALCAPREKRGGVLVRAHEGETFAVYDRGLRERVAGIHGGYPGVPDQTIHFDLHNI